MSSPMAIGHPAGARRPMTRRAAAVLLIVATLLASSPLGAAGTGSPLAGLAGSWAGRGTITTLTGVEHANCTAAYGVEGRTARLALACTSEHFRLDLVSAVVERDGAISGTWSDRVFGTSGAVSGRADGHRLALAATVVGAAVTLSIATEGPQQTVSLRTTSPLVTGGDLVLLRRR